MQEFIHDFGELAIKKMTSANLPDDVLMNDPRVPVETVIVFKCLDDWQTGNPYWKHNFQMVNHCCKIQFEAAKRLGAIK